MKEETEDWLERAESDFEQARASFEREDYSYTGFWLQQAAEKGLKAFLIEVEDEYPFTHDLIELSQNIDIPEDHLDYFPELNTVYVSSRYPGSVDEQLENLEEIIEDVEELISWIKKQLKK